ncbi:site-specific integrase [Aestuariibacter sp. AA17]|uniref:Site-specific integrase n=1 Tax=Fluctibacter corallii TaxID=2984329 RepID=A0ABT3A793_9ALTE|nr:site-specific integrase [Aestuariibacter sp. AA17]MCV2884191.1 site-specific integrase [Aestuariibacter sp. AA17]
MDNPPVKPIFDNIDYLENPFHHHDFSLPVYFRQYGFLTDYEFAWKFIYSYNGSSATYNVYRREVERLIQWSWMISGKSVLELKREDIEDYVNFCISPPDDWIGIKNVARFKNKNGTREINPDWRPFVASISKVEAGKGKKPKTSDFTMSQASIRSIFSVLSSFYNFLIQENISEVNPVLLIRQKSKFLVKKQQKAPVRRISNLQWDYVVETVEKMADEEPETHERTLFILKCLLGMYLRISELVADERSIPVMGDFRRDNDKNWWFHVIGKGNKSRSVTVSDEMLDALKRYRGYLDLSPLPLAGERTPLVTKLLGKGPVTSTRQIRTLLQLCYDKTYQKMMEDGLSDDAEELRVATVHWLRHTAISEDVKIRPREHVRDDAGHGSMETTDRYIESDARERHATGRKKKLSEL